MFLEDGNQKVPQIEHPEMNISMCEKHGDRVQWKGSLEHSKLWPRRMQNAVKVHQRRPRERPHKTQHCVQRTYAAEELRSVEFFF